MTRIGFRLSVAPKFMDIIVRWVIRVFPAVDNYVDDVMIPASDADALAACMLEYSLPMKPAEPFALMRLQGLQLSKGGDGQTQWSRRGDSDLKVLQPATKRDVFSWCGRLTGHVPVCSWLQPACSYLKRMVNADGFWDQPISEPLLKLCDELAVRLASDSDPACGQWRGVCDIYSVGRCIRRRHWCCLGSRWICHRRSCLVEAVWWQTSHQHCGVRSRYPGSVACCQLAGQARSPYDRLEDCRQLADRFCWQWLSHEDQRTTRSPCAVTPADCVRPCHHGLNRRLRWMGADGSESRRYSHPCLAGLGKAMLDAERWCYDRRCRRCSCGSYSNQSSPGEWYVNGQRTDDELQWVIMQLQNGLPVEGPICIHVFSAWYWRWWVA